jgi:hypothetical protein
MHFTRAALAMAHDIGVRLGRAAGAWRAGFASERDARAGLHAGTVDEAVRTGTVDGVVRTATPDEVLGAGAPAERDRDAPAAGRSPGDGLPGEGGKPASPRAPAQPRPARWAAGSRALRRR